MQEKSSDTFMGSSCSCEVICNNSDSLSSLEPDEQQNISPIIWKALKHNSLDFSEFCATFIRKVIVNILCTAGEGCSC